MWLLWSNLINFHIFLSTAVSLHSVSLHRLETVETLREICCDLPRHISNYCISPHTLCPLLIHVYYADILDLQPLHCSCCPFVRYSPRTIRSILIHAGLHFQIVLGECFKLFPEGGGAGKSTNPFPVLANGIHFAAALYQITQHLHCWWGSKFFNANGPVNDIWNHRHNFYPPPPLTSRSKLCTMGGRRHYGRWDPNWITSTACAYFYFGLVWFGVRGSPRSKHRLVYLCICKVLVCRVTWGRGNIASLTLNFNMSYFILLELLHSLCRCRSKSCKRCGTSKIVKRYISF